MHSCVVFLLGLTLQQAVPNLSQAGSFTHERAGLMTGGCFHPSYRWLGSNHPPPAAELGTLLMGHDRCAIKSKSYRSMLIHKKAIFLWQTAICRHMQSCKTTAEEWKLGKLAHCWKTRSSAQRRVKTKPCCVFTVLCLCGLFLVLQNCERTFSKKFQFPYSAKNASITGALKQSE